MSSQVGATLLGLLVAFLFALSAFYQQRAARSTHRQGHSVAVGMLALMSTLVRNRLWLAGWMVNLAGFGVQALALHVGSVATVQPLLATQLMFALPMSSLERRGWPRPQDWLAAGSICAGLVVLLVVVHATPLAGNPDRSRIVLAAVCALAAIVVAVPISTRLGPNVVVVVSAGCAGLCFAMTAVFIKLTTDDLANHGIGYTARDWVGYALACSTLLGLVLGQGAFANGPLPWAVGVKETVNPVASYAIGVLAFPVALPTDAGSLLGMAFAGLLVAAGAVGLAHSPSAAEWLRRREDQAPNTV
ncbi:DMT family transporter [Nocardioides terrisoli]|uniref:DMT family transporter n=1 Tax=Nocardioides terrisoli TaxID=3388267 RepID=UPI00287B70E2|nr:DMT family transporter [Nocardioides marmorisolisilvae]